MGAPLEPLPLVNDNDPPVELGDLVDSSEPASARASKGLLVWKRTFGVVAMRLLWFDEYILLIGVPVGFACAEYSYCGVWCDKTEAYAERLSRGARRKVVEI